MAMIISFVAGVIFSVGLIISGMTNPAKVLGFLDVFGDWDSALLYVLGGAVAFNLVSFSLILKRARPWAASSFGLPLSQSIDRRLLLGSAIFGIGWGLVGLCPGPGLVNLATLEAPFFIFVASMLLGMKVYALARPS